MTLSADFTKYPYMPRVPPVVNPAVPGNTLSRQAPEERLRPSSARSLSERPTRTGAAGHPELYASRRGQFEARVGRASGSSSLSDEEAGEADSESAKNISSLMPLDPLHVFKPEDWED